MEWGIRWKNNKKTKITFNETYVLGMEQKQPIISHNRCLSLSLRMFARKE